MPIETVVLIGAGGHAKVVLDAWRTIDPKPLLLVVDDNPARAGQVLFDAIIEAPIRYAALEGRSFHVAIGNNAARRLVTEQAKRAGGRLVSVFHPNATVSVHATLGAGSFVAAAAVVGPLARIGRGVIVNHAATVDHDCVVEDYCHLAPGVHLCGDVRVGEQVMVGAGAVVLPGLRIGAGSTIGAGAVVDGDVAPGTTVKGVPAR